VKINNFDTYGEEVEEVRTTKGNIGSRRTGIT
jgi:hypothetical protein